MKTMVLGKTGVPVSALCFGTMGLGTKVPLEESLALLDRYFEAGGRFLDTANVYSAWAPNGKGGDSERVLGEWFRRRGCRAELFVATKVGSKFQASGKGLKASQIERESEDSLSRLGLSTLDLLYAHFDDIGTPQEEYLTAFDRLIRQGKVRFIGASNFSSWRLTEARLVAQAKGLAGFQCLQQRFSFIPPKPGAKFGVQRIVTEEIFEVCQAYGLTLLAYSPLLHGLYGKPGVLESMPAYYFPENIERWKAIQELAREKGLKPNPLVLAWMLHLTPPVLPIFSASTLGQMDENLGVLDIVLSPEEVNRLNKVGTMKG